MWFRLRQRRFILPSLAQASLLNANIELLPDSQKYDIEILSW